MKLSAKGEYACLAMLDLSEQFYEGFIKIDRISDRKSIPKKFLEQILLILNRANYVSSKRGSSGGYRLTRPPSEISVAEIIRLVDGAIAPVGCVSENFFSHTPLERSNKLVGVFKEVRDMVSEKLEKTSFGDLL